MCRDTCRGPFFRFREVAFVMPGNTAPDFQPSSFVMPALVAGIHVLLRARQQPDADSRDEFGDEAERQNRESYRSAHSGFIPWMSRTFQARGQCLIVFSR
jgi:hypothetical protein